MKRPYKQSKAETLCISFSFTSIGTNICIGKAHMAYENATARKKQNDSVLSQKPEHKSQVRKDLCLHMGCIHWSESVGFYIKPW